MAVTLNASTVNGLIQTADTSGTLNLQANGTTVLSASPTGVAVTGTITATGGFPGITSGQLQTQLFTAPGTWTKPASATQVRVTVIGGGGGGSTPGVPAASSGGTSSFGPAVSATGGGGAPGSGAPGTSGSGTVSVGTTLKTSDVSGGGAPSTYVYLGVIAGSSIRPGQPAAPKTAIAYSTSSTSIAGARGNGTPTTTESGGVGGVAIAMVPVSAPVTVTVGDGGAGAGPTGPALSGGVGGAVLVEFVG